MNRLVIIGNGFDLAHKMKTSYKDFILDFLKESLQKLTEEKPELELSLAKFKKNTIGQIKILPGNINEWDIKDLVEFTYNTRPPYQYNINIKSEFLSNLLKNIRDYNWVDIENEYYKQLCEYAKEREDDKINKLNEDLKEIQKALVSYLSKEERRYGNEYTVFGKTFVEQVTQNLNKRKDVLPKSILFLNFNYTSTIRYYIQKVQEIVPNTKVINIHGEINKRNNVIIFGYGDEEDVNFNILENNDRYLEFVKTYHYLRNSKYQELLTFLDSDDYEVMVIGHSCGLSDKTLLSEVFNNERCKSIKLLTYNTKPDSTFCIENSDYITKSYQIGRIFKDKASLRRKLLPFEENDIIKLDFLSKP